MFNRFQNQRFRSAELLAVQVLIAVLAGVMVLLIFDKVQALAFVIGALAVALGQFTQYWLTFSGGVQNARVWFGRFLLAVLLKWLLVFVLLLAGMHWLAKAPLAALLGFMCSLLITQLYNLFDAKVKRGS